jgi:hypothetical protein
MQKSIEWMQNYRLNNTDFNIDESVIKTLYRVRQTIAACSLAATISAEAGDLYSAENKLAKEQETLSFLLNKLAQLSLSPTDEVYTTLLRESYKQIMPAYRLNSWINRFDSKFDGLDEIIDLLRENIMFEGMRFIISMSQSEFQQQTEKELESLCGANLENEQGLIELGYSEQEVINFKNIIQDENISEEVKATIFLSLFPRALTFKTITPNTHLFFDLIDGIYEDLQRLKGHQAEYKSMLQLDMNIHEYRNLLRIDDIPENKRLAFIMMKKQNLQMVE